MELPRSQKCEVCFTNPYSLNPHQEIISCIVCKRKAHLYCYSPNQKQPKFTCDGCLYKSKDICAICNNPGLLKKFNNGFAHPVCLFFDHSIIVANFKDLKFANIEVLKSGKKAKCSQCGNKTGGVLSCNSKKCPYSSHLYCAMKSSNASDSRGWRVCLQPLDSQKSFKQVIENQLLRTLRSQNKFIAGQLGIKKTLKTLQVPALIYCEQHSIAIVDCICRQYNEQKLDWVYCESCCRWNHIACLEMSEQQKEKLKVDSGSEFICQECKEWESWVKQRSLSIPERLPKLHLYDYVYINKLLEQLGTKAFFKLIQLAQRIPLLPGLVYGNMFLKQQLVKKLKQKIDLATLRCAIEDRNNLRKILYQRRNEFQILLWITDDSFIGTTHGYNLPHQLEQSVDEQYIDQMISAVEKFEKKWYPNSFNPLVTEKKRNNRVNEQSIKKQRSFSKPASQVSPQSSTFCKAEKEVTDLKQESINFQKLNEHIDHFNQIYKIKPGSPINYVEMFEEMFKVFKQPQVFALLKEQPPNILIKSLSLQTPRHAAVFAQYIGKLHLLQNQILEAQTKDKASKTVQTYKYLRQLLHRWSAIKEKIYNQQKGPELLQYLIQQIEDIQFKNIVFKQPFANDALPNIQDQPNHKKTKPICLINQEYLQRQLRQKRDIMQEDSNAALLIYILERIKNFRFNKQTRTMINKQLVQLSKQSYKAQDIEYFLMQYYQLYPLIESLIRDLNIPLLHNDSACYFQLLAYHIISAQNFLSRAQELSSVVTFLSKINKIRMNVFSFSIQQTIYRLVQILVYYYKQNPIKQEQQLTVLSFWPKVLGIQLPQQLQKIIKLDQSIVNQHYLFKQAMFQNSQHINNLKLQLLEDLPKFEEMKLLFRVRQVKRILSWINIYEKILQRIPLRYILSHQVQNDSPLKYRLKVEQLQSIIQALTQIGFPQGKFKQKLTQLVKIGLQMRVFFQKIDAACNWQLAYATSGITNDKINDNKLQLAQVVEFIATAKKLPVCLQVEAIECEIIIDRFQKNECKASILIKEITTQGKNKMSKQYQKKAKQILNYMAATPIKSNYSEKLLHIMQNLQSPDKHRQTIQKMHAEITSAPEGLTYHEVLWIINYIQMEYEGKLDKNKLLNTLKNYKIIIEECLNEYKDIIEKYETESHVGSEIEIKKVESLAKKYKKSQIQDLILSSICRQFLVYQDLCKQYRHCANSSLPIECKHVKEMNLILKSVSRLHTFFCDQKIAKLNTALTQLIQRKTTEP